MAQQTPESSWIAGEQFQATAPQDQADNNEALRRARASLHDKNKGAKKTRLQIPLDIRISAGDVIELDAAWGPEFSGNWIVDDHTMHIGGNGPSISSLNLHKCLGMGPSSSMPPSGPPKTTANGAPAGSTTQKDPQTANNESGSPTPMWAQMGGSPPGRNGAGGNQTVNTDVGQGD
jgi:hypothetical protein